MSAIEPSEAAGASAAPEAVGARSTASPNPRYERRWMALGVLIIAQIMTAAVLCSALTRGGTRLQHEAGQPESLDEIVGGLI
jgi:hypothetical protein